MKAHLVVMSDSHGYDEAVEQIKVHTRQYAKRQMTWLRRDATYVWIRPDEVEKVLQILMK